MLFLKQTIVARSCLFNILTGDEKAQKFASVRYQKIYKKKVYLGGIGTEKGAHLSHFFLNETKTFCCIEGLRNHMEVV